MIVPGRTLVWLAGLVALPALALAWLDARVAPVCVLILAALAEQSELEGVRAGEVLDRILHEAAVPR